MLPIQRQLKIREFRIEEGFADELHERGVIQGIYGGRNG